MSDVLILIPAYQAASTVAEVVRGVRAHAGACPVVVVDDGSSDGSGAAAEAAGATVLRHPRNQGKGAALQTGFLHAERSGMKAVLTLDSDGQHDPAEIPALLDAHRAQPSALLIGVRRFDAMPRRSRVGNTVSTFFISRFAHTTYADTQSGFRVYPRAAYAGTRFRTTRFDTETELILVSAKLGLPLVEVPVKTIYKNGVDGRSPTHFRNFRDTLRIIRLVVGSPFWKLGARH